MRTTKVCVCVCVCLCVCALGGFASYFSTAASLRGFAVKDSYGGFV